MLDNSVIELSPERCVDVVIACWNRADTIEKAIVSALAQPEVNSVIVVDDASTDDTAAVAEALSASYGNLTVIRQEFNQGPAAARNRALNLCQAKWVTVLDGDDYLLPGRLRSVLEKSGDADFIADDLLQISQENPHLERGAALLGVTEAWPPWVNLQGFVQGNLARRGERRKEMGFLKPVMRRSFLTENALRYDAQLRLGEDFIFYAQALALGARFRLISVAGYVAVLREGSLSACHGVEDLQALLDRSQALLTVRCLHSGEKAALRSYCFNLRKKTSWLMLIDAVKTRKLGRVIRNLIADPNVAPFLFWQLAEQIWLRSLARLCQRRLLLARFRFSLSDSPG